jgi:hypothetical protein
MHSLQAWLRRPTQRGSGHDAWDEWVCLQVMGNMVAAGVFERYPGLHLVVAYAAMSYRRAVAREPGPCQAVGVMDQFHLLAL